MNRLSALVTACLLLAGCPFTPEDLELTAGSPSLGAGGQGGPQGGPMSEPDLNALVPEQTQDEIRGAAHRMLQGTVEGDCAVSVRIDVLQGPPAPGDLGAKTKKGPPDGMAKQEAKADPAGNTTPPPKDEPGSAPPPPETPDVGGEPPPPSPGPQGSGPGGPPKPGSMGPITTLRIERPGPFSLAAPPDRSLRLVALCDGNEDGYLTHSDDRISPPVDLGVPDADADGLVLVLAEPQMPSGGGPGGPPAGGPGGPPPPQ